MSLPTETREHLVQVCRQFIPIASTAGVVPIAGGFSGANVWRIEDGDRTYALRQWPAAGPELSRLRGLHRLLQLVWSHGLEEIAVPLSSVPGQTIVPGSENNWQLEPWMPGIADFHAAPNPERLNTTMRRLARWHAAARLFVPEEQERTWFEHRMAPPIGLCERLLKFTQWQSGARDSIRNGLKPTGRSDSTWSASTLGLLHEIYERVQLLVQPVSERLKPLAVQPVWQHPCLRDVWHDHLLFTGNRLTGLIDPGACRTDHVTADLSRLLGSLLEDDRNGWTQALDVYQSFQPLTLHDWKLLNAYDQSGVIIAGIIWLEWCLLPGKIFSDRSSVELRLRTVLRRLKSLAMTL